MIKPNKPGTNTPNFFIEGENTCGKLNTVPQKPKTQSTVMNLLLLIQQKYIIYTECCFLASGNFKLSFANGIIFCFEFNFILTFF